ncbi:MAG TPA: Rieske 2Fe-2S domain-containing protein [Rhodoferax sp.]|jgi:nitrite reductase/ring-hydroxylating ferredoxin subunit|nr:Rieske 2Fe-2S domain-containing protein [Rhodoferax sp.]HNV59694.1 Rieske 2Fe-2S domain-containing protein [Rhodoferax sp.]
MSTSTTPLWNTLAHAPTPGTALGAVSDLPDGQATLMALDTGGGIAQPFRLVMLRNGLQVRAFVNRCPHFGVPLAAKQTLLISRPGHSITCNVHYARFRWSDGVCDSGECLGEGLIPVPVDISANGQITIGSIGP